MKKLMFPFAISLSIGVIAVTEENLIKKYGGETKESLSQIISDTDALAQLLQNIKGSESQAMMKSYSSALGKWEGLKQKVQNLVEIVSNVENQVTNDFIGSADDEANLLKNNTDSLLEVERKLEILEEKRENVSDYEVQKSRLVAAKIHIESERKSILSSTEYKRLEERTQLLARVRTFFSNYTYSLKTIMNLEAPSEDLLRAITEYSIDDALNDINAFGDNLMLNASKLKEIASKVN